MEKESKIYEFNPIIYPFRLWVGINIPTKSVQEKFFAHNFDDTISDFTDNDLWELLALQQHIQ